MKSKLKHPIQHVKHQQKAAPGTLITHFIMLFSSWLALKKLKPQRFLQSPHRRISSTPVASSLLVYGSQSKTTTQIETITRIINDHPFGPDQPLRHILHHHHLSPASLTADLVEDVLGRLFAAHSNGLKALEFFRFSLRQSAHPPTPGAFEKTLHILARMRYFPQAWDFMVEIRKSHPHLLTLKSMSILLSRIAKSQSFEDTLEAFERMEKVVFAGKKFGTEEFNVLLRAFCTQREMKEARSVFQKMHHRFDPDVKTMNILLLGFKESGDVTAMELFYHEMVRRGFSPNTYSYSIRIDAYCKKGHFGDALRLFEEMEMLHNCLPTLQIITTLIHGAGVARNKVKARQLFDEIPERKLSPDTGAYNALISSLVRCRDVQSAMRVMDEMEEKGVDHDSVTYHTIFSGLIKSGSFEGVCELYRRMIARNFVPKTRTTVMLMKLFCMNTQVDLGLDLWDYLVEKGYCPHAHALDLLVTALCSRGRLQEAFRCCKEFLERGMHIHEALFRMMERSLQQSDETDKLRELNQIREKLHSVLPPRRMHAIVDPCSVVILPPARTATQQ
ncbi:hypothetical protein Tsubulata_020126 [Turnera subulata]|uniref:Pentacotripeptide-repeat region of PRORP domain-containing protein n=1 Tax=Turnera subulata TaxID=218843 RepID=A0A9Q0G1N8_9ROSI|nr:hypothetical protein Tsubulata_020126 [Turnera subulata]